MARLRAKNRALLNSILGIAGAPPITVLPDSVSIGSQDARSLHLEGGRGSAPAGATQPRLPSAQVSAAIGKTRRANLVTPMRKRSWHQIYRMLEIDSARKKPQEAVDIPPATTRS
ncbi:MAG TPA: hypothetical protein VHN10_05125 [Candidatus Acidoferrales bacterium]|nr:hypothetical protein [Candidatus Acidoferrales bacterium]